MILKCIQKNNINLDSYNKKSVVDYYDKFSENGLLNYEKYIINKFIKKDGAVIDIGCGTGRITKELFKLGYKVVGIDYSKEMINVARIKSPNVEFYVQDVLSLTFDNNSFKYAIFSFNGLMLIETYEKRVLAMNEINRILQKQGICFFTTPFLDNKIEGKFWANKIQKYKKDIELLTNYEKMKLGDERIEDNNSQFNVHVPFLDEIQNLIKECGFELLFSIRRLNLQYVENCEEELDDNYIWVVRKNVLL